MKQYIAITMLALTLAACGDVGNTEWDASGADGANSTGAAGTGAAAGTSGGAGAASAGTTGAAGTSAGGTTGSAGTGAPATGGAGTTGAAGTGAVSYPACPAKTHYSDCYSPALQRDRTKDGFICSPCTLDGASDPVGCTAGSGSTTRLCVRDCKECT